MKEGRVILTEEVKHQIVEELHHDVAQMSGKASQLRPPYQYISQYEIISQMAYITAQMRLKLHLLGAAISSSEVE